MTMAEGDMSEVDAVEWVDPVQVREMWQATCDDCGWHTQPTMPKDAVREWARLHRATCPLKVANVMWEIG